VLGPAQLLARLTDRFRLLVGGSRTALPRQQTLRALIDWSYDLLNETERTLLRRLSVFAGGWSTDGAARVAGGEPIEDWDVFDLMSALVDKSLVVADLARDEPRYRLLESTREYAAERRRHSGDPDRLRNLAEYMVEFYGTAELAWPTTPTESWLEAYGPEIENLRAAIDWAFGRDGDPVLGVALVARADRIVEELSLGAELRRWSETALQHLGPAIPEIEIVRIRDAVTTHIVGIGQASIVPTRRETVALARACGDPLLLGRTLARLAFSLTRPGEPNEEARALFDEAIRTLGSVGSNKLLATAQSGYAALHLVSGDAATARHLAEEALAICRRFGHRNGILGCNAVLAEADYAQGDVIEAIERAEEGLAAARDQNAMNRVCLLLTNLAAYRLALDQVAQGRAAAREALGLARALDHEAGAMFCLEHLALAAALDGAVEAAGLILGFTEHWYQTHQVNREPTEEKGHAKLLGLLAALPPSRLDALTRTGSGWTLETAAANAA
jgi:tetratricopeptide (TPR) repeat protein